MSIYTPAGWLLDANDADMSLEWPSLLNMGFGFRQEVDG